MKFFLCVLGLVMVIEGMPYFVSPPKMKQFLSQLLDIPDSSLRVMGLFIMLLGLFLVYLGRTV